MTKFEQATKSNEDIAACYLLTMKIIAKHPELRFQQIMSIAAHKAGWKQDDLFYCPNDVIIKGLDLLLQEVCPDDD